MLERDNDPNNKHFKTTYTIRWIDVGPPNQGGLGLIWRRKRNPNDPLRFAKGLQRANIQRDLAI